MAGPRQEGDDQIVVVGGGPAGLMAAEVVAEAGQKVILIDRMPSVGRKFLLAGRGGLNLTHSEPIEVLLSRYGPARAMLEAAIRAFPPESLRAWCDSLGQPTFVGSSGRVFPVAMKAAPLLRAWLHRLDGLGVQLLTRRRWLGWDGQGALSFSGPDGDTLCLRPRAAVLALGGGSWARLGSDGKWTALMADDGILVAPLRPANCGFTVGWSLYFRTRFAGAPLKRIALRLGACVVRGEAMVTAEGIEGGAVYAMSAALRDTIEREGSVDVRLDLRPDLDTGQLTRLLSSAGGGQSLSNLLRKAAGVAPVGIALVREILIHRSPSAGEPAARDPTQLAGLIKDLPLRLTGVRPIDRAISTAGGVSVTELTAGLMLRRRPGVFLAGEMIDWEAPTGGYLLQAALSTGRLAGENALAWRRNEDHPNWKKGPFPAL